MVEFNVQSNIKGLKPNAIVVAVDQLQTVSQDYPFLKKIKEKDYPSSGNYRSWSLLDEGLQVVIHQIDFKDILSHESFKKLIQSLSDAKCSQVVFYAPTALKAARLISRLVRDASFAFDDFLSQKAIFNIKSFHLIGKAKNLAQEIALGDAIGSAMNTTRYLAEMPSNICTPSYLAKKAQEIGKKSTKIQVNVFGEKEIKSIGMNSFLSVAKGSVEAPKFITLQYKGSKEAPIVLVGKGITFDTGGHSLKPAQNMMGMKFDMSGAASVLGVFEFLAEHKPDISVIGLIPTCENIPGTNANKPDDVVVSLSGQTIEILNTDAEGRLILCDALTYAKRFDPKYVIDIATLTGACIAALGSHASGLMSNNSDLASNILKAGYDSLDKAWEFPLWPEYYSLIKSPVADMANIGGPNAGTITAGCFLSKFTQDYAWAHLDVAGTACVFQGHKRGSTGRPVPLLCEFLLNCTQSDSKN